MVSKKKTNIIMLSLVILVMVIIFGILYLKNSNLEENTMKCIAEKSFIYDSKTCTACAYQKTLLGDYVGFFDFRDISEHPEAFTEYNIPGTPSWIINDEVYAGARSIEQLKEITGC